MASLNAIEGEQPSKHQRFSGSNDNGDNSEEVPIRTVYVGGSTRYTIDEINSHFGQFGEIESVAIRYEDKQTRWCLVQFKRAKDAKEALLRTGNKWNWCDVRAADPWSQPDHPLQVAPEQDSDSNISVALNDDCLQTIFERLKPLYLTNLAGVCKRFNAQAKITFALKHKHLNLAEQFYWHDDSIEAMKHFGKGIQSLSVDAKLFSNEADAIRLIGQYCGPKLKQLQLQGFKFCSDLDALRPIFAGIERLGFHSCCDRSIGFSELLACCVELKSLSWNAFWNQLHLEMVENRYLFSGTFPKLQELSIDCDKLCDETFDDFVACNPTLIELSIEDAELTPRLLRTIGQHAKNLQELKLFRVQDENAQFQKDAAHIGQLSALKKLHIYIVGGSIVPLLNGLVAGKVPIECLVVGFNWRTSVRHAIKYISQLKRIKVLHLKTYELSRRVTDEDVVGLAECLPELEELDLAEIHGRKKYRLDYEFKSQLSTAGLREMLMHANKLKLFKLHSIDGIKIDVDDYKAMLSIVQKRKEKVPLMIEILHRKTDQVDVPAQVLTENQNTLNIIKSK